MGGDRQGAGGDLDVRRTVEGRPVRAAYSRSHFSGWTVMVGVPTAQAAAPLHRKTPAAGCSLGRAPGRSRPRSRCRCAPRLAAGHGARGRGWAPGAGEAARGRSPVRCANSRRSARRWPGRGRKGGRPRRRSGRARRGCVGHWPR